MPHQAGLFVGRDDVVRELQAALAAAGSGAGSVALIHGETGIGKTRLCEWIGRAHGARGGRFLLGRAAPEESEVAFGAIADTLRAARRSEPAVWDAARGRADLLHAVTPELGDWTQDGRGRVPDRLVVFEALLEVVEESARGDEATFWVLDDVHWADDATWHFVRYAARRVEAMSLVLAVTYRDEEIGPASHRWTSLVQMRRDPHVSTVPLHRLGPADASRLARRLSQSWHRAWRR